MNAPKKWIQAEIASLDPHVDYAKIWRLMSCYGLNDFMQNLIYAYTFPNFIVTDWGVETIWREDGGKILNRPAHRVEQTAGANALWWWFGPHDARTQKSIEGINRLHAHWSKTYPGAFSYNEDYIYVCAFTAITMHRIRLHAGLPGISEKEQIAAHIFWREMSKLFVSENNTPLHSYPEDFNGLIRFCEDYENTPRSEPPKGRLTTLAMQEQFVSRFFPKELSWLGHQFIRSITIPQTLRTMGVEPAFPLAQEVLPKFFGFFLWYHETQMDDPPRSYVEEREALSAEERKKIKASITALDKSFPDHFREVSAGSQELAGCPYHAALLARPQSEASQPSDEIADIERKSGLLKA